MRKKKLLEYIDKLKADNVELTDDIKRIKRNEEQIRSEKTVPHYVESDIDYMMMLAEHERWVCRSGWFVQQAKRIKAAIDKIAELEEKLTNQICEYEVEIRSLVKQRDKAYRTVTDQNGQIVELEAQIEVDKTEHLDTLECLARSHQDKVNKDAHIAELKAENKNLREGNLAAHRKEVKPEYTQKGVFNYIDETRKLLDEGAFEDCIESVWIMEWMKDRIDELDEEILDRIIDD